MKHTHLIRAIVIANAVGLLGCSSQSDRLARLEQRVAQLEAANARQPQTQHPSARPELKATSEEGWLMSGGGREVYAVQPDGGMQRSGHSTLLLTAVGDPQEKYGTWMRHVDATAFHGKRIRLSAYVRTEGATRRADFWARIQAPDSPGDGSGLGGQWIHLPPTSDWTRTEIVLDVPAAGSSIQYGVGVAGPGKLWVDEAKLEIVGEDVPVTKKAL